MSVVFTTNILIIKIIINVNVKIIKYAYQLILYTCNRNTCNRNIVFITHN